MKLHAEKSCNHFICTFSLFVCTQQSIFLYGLLSSKFEFYIFVVAHKKFLFFIIADCHSNESTEYCVYKPHFSIQVKIELNEFLLFFLLLSNFQNFFSSYITLNKKCLSLMYCSKMFYLVFVHGLVECIRNIFFYSAAI